MPEFVETFDDFSGGHHGLVLAARAPKDSFFGENVAVYSDGTIGERNERVEYTLTGLPNGVIHGLGAYNDGQRLWAVIGTAVVSFSLTGDPSSSRAATTYTGTLDAAPTHPLTFFNSSDASVNRTYILSEGDAYYRLDHTAETVTKIAAGPDGRMTVLYGERAVIGQSGRVNRWRYSDAADFETWPALNFIDVGGRDPITGLFPLRDVLLIAKPNQWFQHSGVPGSGDTLRRLDEEPGPGDVEHGAVLPDSTVGMVTPYDYRVARFTGSVTHVARHLHMTRWEARASTVRAPGAKVVQLGSQGTWFVMQDKDATAVAASPDAGAGFLFMHGVWTRQVFASPDAQAWLAPASREGEHDALAMGLDGDGSNPPRFFSWLPVLPDQSRPLPRLEEKRSARLPSTPHFITPQIERGGDKELSIRAVIVHLRRYNTGFGGDNSMNVQVLSTRHGADEVLSGTVSTWSTAESTAAEGGTLERVIFTFPERVWARGVRLRIGNLRGVLIESFDVLGEERPAQIAAGAVEAETDFWTLDDDLLSLLDDTTVLA